MKTHFAKTNRANADLMWSIQDVHLLCSMLAGRTSWRLAAKSRELRALLMCGWSIKSGSCTSPPNLVHPHPSISTPNCQSQPAWFHPPTWSTPSRHSQPVSTPSRQSQQAWFHPPTVNLNKPGSIPQPSISTSLVPSANLQLPSCKPRAACIKCPHNC
jgi:hypothetical protein